MKKIDIKSLLIGSFLGVAIMLSAGAATSGRVVREYKVLYGRLSTYDLQKQINSSVADGWEFVSVSGPNDNEYGLAVMRR